MDKLRVYDLEERLINFTVSVLDLAEKLPNTRVGNYYSDQIIRSCSSPSLNYGEAQAAESKADFIHKMKVCLKELRETSISLKIIKKKKMILEKEIVENILKENLELIAIFTSSIQTAKNKK